MVRAVIHQWMAVGPSLHEESGPLTSLATAVTGESKRRAGPRQKAPGTERARGTWEASRQDVSRQPLHGGGKAIIGGGWGSSSPLSLFPGSRGASRNARDQQDPLLQGRVGTRHPTDARDNPQGSLGPVGWEWQGILARPGWMGPTNGALKEDRRKKQGPPAVITWPAIAVVFPFSEAIWGPSPRPSRFPGKREGRLLNVYALSRFPVSLSFLYFFLVLRPPGERSSSSCHGMAAEGGARFHSARQQRQGR